MNSTTTPPKGRAHVAVAVLAAAAVAAASSAVAQAAPTDESFGQHVARCAQISLGKRANPPAVSCSHAGQGDGFTTFGEMVQAMREHHGGH